MSVCRLLIVEYLCAGFIEAGLAAPSLLAEGRAMLLALLEDVRRLKQTRVTTLWRADLGTLTAIDVVVLTTVSPHAAIRAWHNALSEVDAVYIIAPETDHTLSRLCVEALQHGVSVLNCTPAAIELTGDKWRTHQVLTELGIPTIPTRLSSDMPAAANVAGLESPLVVKPRDGCGSEGIEVIHDPELLFEKRELFADAIVQPLITGQSASVSAVFNDRGTLNEIFPLGVQRLTPELKYLGGTIPADWPHASTGPRRLAGYLERIGSTIPGLRGYVGFDLLIRPDGSLLIVEINPRLTTSYIGYRSLTQANLAERWLSPASSNNAPIEWLDRRVTFEADGTTRSRRPS